MGFFLSATLLFVVAHKDPVVYFSSFLQPFRLTRCWRLMVNNGLKLKGEELLVESRL